VPAIEIEGSIGSLYCRDPDGNLIELASREAKTPNMVNGVDLRIAANHMK
jgi:hypothetical protein